MPSGWWFSRILDMTWHVSRMWKLVLNKFTRIRTVGFFGRYTFLANVASRNHNWRNSAVVREGPSVDDFVFFWFWVVTLKNASKNEGMSKKSFMATYIFSSIATNVVVYSIEMRGADGNMCRSIASCLAHDSKLSILVSDINWNDLFMGTLPETLSHPRVVKKMNFLFHWWDMLVLWRAGISITPAPSTTASRSSKVL